MIQKLYSTSILEMRIIALKATGTTIFKFFKLDFFSSQGRVIILSRICNFGF